MIIIFVTMKNITYVRFRAFLEMMIEHFHVFLLEVEKKKRTHSPPSFPFLICSSAVFSFCFVFSLFLFFLFLSLFLTHTHSLYIHSHTHTHSLSTFTHSHTLSLSLTFFFWKKILDDIHSALPDRITEKDDS